MIVTGKKRTYNNSNYSIIDSDYSDDLTKINHYLYIFKELENVITLLSNCRPEKDSIFNLEG